MRKLATPILVPGGLTAGGIPASAQSQPETSRRDEMNSGRQPLQIKVFFVLILAALMTAGENDATRRIVELGDQRINPAVPELMSPTCGA